MRFASFGRRSSGPSQRGSLHVVVARRKTSFAAVVVVVVVQTLFQKKLCQPLFVKIKLHTPLHCNNFKKNTARKDTKRRLGRGRKGAAARESKGKRTRRRTR